MLAYIKLPYNWRHAISEKGREAYQELRKQCDWLPEWKEGNSEPEYFYAADDKGTLVDLDTDGKALAAAGLEFTVHRFKGNYFPNDTADFLRRHGDRFISDAPQAVHVHIPNIGLLAINEVTWLEDACTQELQSHLDDGWRILAVCPPDSVRRPTYILGRTKEK